MVIDRREWILQKCTIGERILDIGSADGWVFNNTPFRQYVTSIDLDLYDIPNFYQMNANNLQFPDKCFDIAILGEILEHVEDPVQVLKEANRVAKRVLMTIPNEYEWDKSLFPFEKIEEGMERRNLSLEDIVRVSNPNTKEFYTEDNHKHLFHNRYYKEDTLRSDLDEAGIKEYALDYLRYGGWSFFTIDTSSKLYKIVKMIDEIKKRKALRLINSSENSSETNSSKTNIGSITHNVTGPIIIFGPDVDINNMVNILPGKDKLRIALISTPFFGVPPSKYGGLEQVVWDLAEGLDELGHLVTIFGPEGSKTPNHGSLVVTGPALDTVNVNWFNEEEKRFHVWKDIITNDRFDIIHDHTWFGFPYLHKMNNLRLRVIHTHHGGYNWNTAPPFPKPNLVSISKWMKQYTEQYFKQKGFNVNSEYVYNGVDLNRYKFDPSIQKTKNLLFVGRLSTFKQPNIVVNIARKTNLKLDIIGSASFVDSQDYVKQLERSIYSDHEITLHKDVSHDFKIKKMQEAMALILPSKMQEPFGLVAVEAMACGCPVICTRDGALPEIVIDRVTGYICDTEEQMLETVKNLYHEIDKIDPAKCRERAEQFSKKIMAENYQNLYQRMMKDDNW